MTLVGYDDVLDLGFDAGTICLKRGQRRHDGLSVLMKLVPDEPVPAARLELEARVLGALASPQFPTVLELTRHRGQLARITTDSGAAPLPRCDQGPTALDDFLAIASSLAKALAVLHAKGFVHRGLRPSSLLFDRATQEVQIVDLESATLVSRLSATGSDAELPAACLPYMSPEQSGRMNRPCDNRTDFYSFGVTAFELLTGRRPFVAADSMGWIHAHVSKPAPDPRTYNPAIPTAIAEIVNKLLSKDPDRRYQTAGGLQRDLERCRRGWTAGRDIPSFALGTDDVSDRFAVSQRLFGRDAETATLLRVFEKVRRGSAQLCLVGGPSGVGKSSLVRQVQPAIVLAEGSFVAGKFDQLERNVPYGALLQALRTFVRHLLGQSDARLAESRARLLRALGPNGAVMVELIPELESIVGPQPPVPTLNPQESRARVLRLFGELVRALARADHPLVVFIDDLQWADLSTIELLVQLLSAPSTKHLLVIGAYRDNEVSDGHPLSQALRAIAAKRPEAVERLVLSPLSEASVGALIAETLHSDSRRVETLATVVYQKTGGNPFFVNELLGELHREGVFVFSPDSGQWQWDPVRVRSIGVTANIADLVVARLERLSPATRRTIAYAACLGGTFSLSTLAQVMELPSVEVGGHLAEATNADVILPLGLGAEVAYASLDDQTLGDLPLTFRFQHDRIHEAAYKSLPEIERAHLHLRVGRLLSSTLAGRARDERLFDIVNHLNRGRVAMETSAERVALARLNAQAGERARNAGAHAISLDHYEASLRALSPDEWATERELEHTAALGRAQGLLLTGDLEQAASLAASLTDSAPNKLLRAAAVALRVTMLEQQGRLHEAVDIVRGTLVLFGIHLPRDPAAIDGGIAQGIAKMQEHLARVSIESLPELPELQDPELRAAMDLLFQVIPAAIQTYPPTFILAELVMFDLALVHGVTSVTAKNLVDCGIIQGAILGEYDAAYRLGKAAFALLARYAPTPLESGVNFVFAAFVSHWKAPLDEGQAAFAEATRAGLELGDVRHTAYARVHLLQRLLLTGRSLADCAAEGEHTLAYAREIRSTLHAAAVDAAQRVVASLRGTASPGHPGDDFTRDLVALGNAQWLYSYGQAQAFASFILGANETCEAWAAFTRPFLPASGGLYSGPDFHLFEALSIAQRATRQGPEGREAALTALREKHAMLARWATACPENFLHKAELCAAEIARLEGLDWREIVTRYEAARAAVNPALLPLRALIDERLGRFWIEQGLPKLGRGCLEEAFAAYHSWGAVAKTRALTEEFPAWFVGVHRPEMVTTDHASSSALDIDSITKATRAISGEVQPERLFAKLMATLIECAGAQVGYLLTASEGGDRLTIEAEARVDGSGVARALPAPIEARDDLAHAVIRYVARSRQPVVLDDAADDPQFRGDEHIRQHGVQSLMCVPVLNQGQLIAVLYAENNVTTRAFAKDRLSLLEIIAGQAAVSITNAQLYRNLENKVAERTGALAEKNREMATMLNTLQQGVFTVGPDLCVQPQYSPFLEAVVGAANLAGQDAVSMLFASSDVEPGALATLRAALECSLGGPTIFARINLEHVVRACRRRNDAGELRDLELDWELIADDNDDVAKILVVVRDVTELRRIQEKAARESREIEILGQILGAGAGPFRQFQHSAARLLNEVEAHLDATPPYDRATVDAMFRNLHTLKGNARMLALGRIAEVVHQAEEPFARLRDRPDADTTPDALRNELATAVTMAEQVVREYQVVYEERLGRLMAHDETRVAELTARLRELLGEVDARGVHPQRAIERIRSFLDGAEAVPLSRLVRACAEALPRLAKEVDKPPPLVDCQDQGLCLPPRWAALMGEVITHSFHNAVDHGLEPPEERRRAGKQPNGLIGVRVERTDRGPRVRLWDDGRGLALAVLREALGLPQASDDEIAQTIFQTGVSTARAASPLSGRGVGMDAIRTRLRGEGGDVSVVFNGESRDGYRPFTLLFVLPPQAEVTAHPASGRFAMNVPRNPGRTGSFDVESA